MKLTSEAVQRIISDCLYKEDEITDEAVLVEGIRSKYGFHPDRLMNNKTEIGELLTELPEEFHTGTGDGWSFLNACVTKEGSQWGEHRDVEALMVLGLATEQVSYLMPRDMWKLMPGGMPYFKVEII